MEKMVLCLSVFRFYDNNNNYYIVFVIAINVHPWEGEIFDSLSQ